MSARPGILRLIADDSQASQGHAELYWLLNKVDAIKPKVVLEIGVHRGFSLKVWQEAWKPKRMIGVDNETNEFIEGMINSRELKANFLIADSHDPLTLGAVQVYLDEDKVDFLFIDGDHTYQGVKQDFEIYSPLVRKGGIIAFDDMAITDHPLVDVYKFWDEIKDGYKHDSLHADSNGLGILYV